MSYFVPVDDLLGGAVLGSTRLQLPGYASPQAVLTPVVGVAVHVYARGTTTPVDCFTDQHGGGTPLAQPFVTDAGGRVVADGDRVFTAQPAELDIAISGGSLAAPVTFPSGIAGDGGGGGAVTKAAIIDTGLAPADIGAATAAAAAAAMAAAVAEANRAEDAESALGSIIVGQGPPAVYRVVRPSGGDDTAAIKAAIAAAVAAAAAGPGYCEVLFDMTGAPFLVQGARDTSQFGNAQIPLPWRDPSVGNQKIVLALCGMRDGSAVAHWQQTDPQKAGATLVSNLVSVFNPALGSASVIGGPNPEQLVDSGNPTFSNMLVIIDGIAVQSSYSDPAHNAIDLQRVAQAHIKSLAAAGNVAPGTATPNPSVGGAGLRMPQRGNNANCKIDTYTCEGYTAGIVVGEHTVADRIGCYYCHEGVLFAGVTPDAVWISALSTESCVNHLSTRGSGPSGTSKCNIDIGTMEVEDGNTVAHIDDPLNLLRGSVQFRRNKNDFPGPDAGVASGPGAPPVVIGAAGFRIINAAQSPGAVAAPAVPATTVALKNPFWRDAAVTVVGDGLSDIAVDGVSTGLVPGTVIVPSGKTIAVTYAGAVNWNWVLL